MPELPEVETIASQLAPVVAGGRVVKATVDDPRWCSPEDPVRFARRLEGLVIEGLERRGKYLIWRFAKGLALLQHLRMSGVILLDPRERPNHLRATLRLRKGGRELELAVCDLRRFGTATLFAEREALERYLAARLGPEPFDDAFNGAYLRDRLRGRAVAIKAALLDQRLVAGVGNIYADEALFRAGIDPCKEAGGLTAGECEALVEGLRAALRAGIGVRGTFQDRFLVHRREGQPCPRCSAPIERLRVGGRSTYRCPRCQRTVARRRQAARRARR